ncbi:glycosyltransferase family 2 protein [Sphingobacterium paludis]|uniref:Glycosyl transferase family 2 n=1 Tax=Sphingobacterium paludis TaxID=1476465 RepID=A0A4R7D2F8_9SPHI|nr:glycosyltransferase family 2 protein [Sphingobacterium paludis]TDS13785.1 glycosyl transferase family 2 [Sphingobacterium paludis]
MSTLSFILPVFKANYLKEAINSILNQTFTDFELIIVNDQSPDNISEIVGEFSDERIKFYENEVNIGGKDLVENWNRCLVYATGEWVVLASDDDYYDPKFAEKLLDKIQQYPSVSLVHCRYKVINGKDEVIEISEPCLAFEQPEEFVFQNIIKRRRQVAPDFMFKLADLQQVGGFVNFPLAWGSDDATWCKLALNAGVAYVDEILFTWRFSGINISAQQNNVLKKAKTRIHFLAYFNREIIPFLKTDNIIAAYYTKVTQHNLTKSIQGEVVNTIASSRSFKVLFALLKDRALRELLGIKNLLKMTFVMLYFRTFKR